MHLPSAILAAIVLLCCSHRSQALCSNGHCQLRQVCLRSADCSAGLFCSTCVANGDALRRCHRFMTTNATAIRGDLPFNRYSWITTHNSFAIVGEPSHTGVPRLTFVNQEDSVSTQLKNGVRGLMLDMYDFLGNVWLCHSYGGVCYNFTAFEPAINALKEVEAFLLANPTEIVTVFIEDYVRSTKGLTNVFTEAGLKKYWFPVSLMPKSGGDWPTIIEMVAKNYRLVVFTSNRTKEASEGIAYNWRYVNENQYGNGGMTAGECPKRAESAAMNSTSRSLVLVNFFRDNPVQAQACKYNSAPLKAMLPVCYAASGNRWPNYVAVDFYKENGVFCNVFRTMHNIMSFYLRGTAYLARYDWEEGTTGLVVPCPNRTSASLTEAHDVERSDGGGALVAMDMVNAGLMCGCSDINVCKLNLPFGVCNVSSSTDPPTALLQPNATSQANFHKRSPYPLLYVVSILLYICTIT